MNLTAVEIKAFVPSRDLKESIDFYLALGFEVPWMNENMAYVRHDTGAFLLQKFYVKEHAENFMMHMLVEDVDAWYRNVVQADVKARFNIHVEVPENRPWGIRDFPLVDPSGVLWRIGQNI